MKDHNLIQAVAKFRLENALYLLHNHICLDILPGEADAMLANPACARVGGHNDNDIAKICLSALIVCQGGIIHHLQENVVNVRVRFLNLI